MPSRVRPPDRRRLELGARGEDLAAGWYAGRGYELVARNWRGEAGELDLVVRRGGVLVFCEVKTRRGPGFGSPAEAVTWAKRARIRRLASEWLAAQPRDGRVDDVRFDVACVTAVPGREPDIEVIEAAF